MSSQRILFIAEGQLGDLLLLTPALRAVKDSFPSSFLSVLVVDRRTPLCLNRIPSMYDVPLESCPLSTNKNVDELILISRQFLRGAKGFHRLRCETSLVRLLRRKRFDTVVCTFPEDRFALWAFASGAKTRIGQRNQSLHWLLTRVPPILKTDRGVLEYYCDLARAIGATIRSTKTEYTISPEADDWAEQTLRHYALAGKKIIALHPGASGDYRIWQPERYAELIDRLSSKATVVLIGGKFDEPIIAAIKNSLRSDVIHVSIDWNGNLAALLRRCALCISNNSGPRHLAIAVGTPSLALFGRHQEREWAAYEESDCITTVRGIGVCPVCPPNECLDKNPHGEQFGSHCIRMISVNDVVLRVEQMLVQ